MNPGRYLPGLPSPFVLPEQQACYAVSMLSCCSGMQSASNLQLQHLYGTVARAAFEQKRQFAAKSKASIYTTQFSPDMTKPIGLHSTACHSHPGSICQLFLRVCGSLTEQQGSHAVQVSRSRGSEAFNHYERPVTGQSSSLGTVHMSRELPSGQLCCGRLTLS